LRSITYKMSIQFLYTLKCKHRIHKKTVTNFYHFVQYPQPVYFFSSYLLLLKFFVFFSLKLRKEHGKDIYFIFYYYFSSFPFLFFFLCGYVLLFFISVLIFCSNLYINFLVNFTLNSKNNGEKEIFISSFVLVLIFCYNLCIIIISKSNFFYVIYAKDGRKKTYLCDKTSFYTYKFYWNGKKCTEKKFNFYYISINFDWVLKLCLQGSYSKRIVNNLCVCLYFL
jgi:hypothetical protein